MHSSSMYTVHSLTLSHSIPWGGGCAHPPGCGLPPDEDLPGCSPSPTQVDRMTDACENITLLQTSFAGGNNYFAAVIMFIPSNFNRATRNIEYSPLGKDLLFFTQRLLFLSRSFYLDTVRNVELSDLVEECQGCS